MSPNPRRKTLGDILPPAGTGDTPPSRTIDTPAPAASSPSPVPLPAPQASLPPAAAQATAEPLSDQILNRWRWTLGATARALAAAEKAAAQRRDEWAVLCADAEAAHVPRRMVIAAAADADIDIPGAGQ